MEKWKNWLCAVMPSDSGTDNIVLGGKGQGWRLGFSDRGADSSDKGAKIRLSGYCKCQKSPTK